jgi:hypothetical protein
MQILYPTARVEKAHVWMSSSCQAMGKGVQHASSNLKGLSYEIDFENVDEN